ncbi:hypothetical protein [Streptacidiphilus jiangxiensis]|uniref:hypothetical protein n=1 Tax=Streptacidiphilus jiangxiensis TaxID=235985 RepID=UPI001F161167|nr:hypothetical protein [Streptacidiphilus jiangxiensis]
MADLGFDARWTCVRASDVGAPHRRERIFLAAWAADPEGPGREGPRCRSGGPGACSDAAQDPDQQPRFERGLAASGQTALGRTRPEPAGRGRAPHTGADGRAAADAEGQRRHPQRPESARQQGRSDPRVGDRPAAADPQGQRQRHAGAPGRGGLPPAVVAGGAAAVESPGRGATAGDAIGGKSRWGPYAEAVARWERATRPAPAPTDDRGRLAPEFVEWVMGLPAGWVTATPGLSRPAQLTALGNGVVPQQAAHALRLLRPPLPCRCTQPTAPRCWSGPGG